ncbi:MAG: hypothetical protein NVS2B14_00110 [Chamaesiphon sp.]
MPKTKTATIDPVKVCVLALQKTVKSAADYYRVESANTKEVFSQALAILDKDSLDRLDSIIAAATPPTPETIAEEFRACGSQLELKHIKAEVGEELSRAAWKLLSAEDKDRLRALCSAPGAIAEATQQPPQTKQTLLNLTEQLQNLDTLLDTIEGDIPPELQQAVDGLLGEKELTEDAIAQKLDNYCALIQNRLSWAEQRKREAERLAKLAESDFKTVEFLKSRLKLHLEQTGKTKTRTERFNISVCKNGGKQPLRFDDIKPEDLPEEFQRVSIEPDREAIRQALESGSSLPFAYLGERETHIRIN